MAKSTRDILSHPYAHLSVHSNLISGRSLYEIDRIAAVVNRTWTAYVRAERRLPNTSLINKVHPTTVS